VAYDSGLSPADVREVFDTGLADAALNTWIGVAESRAGEIPDALSDSKRSEVTKFLAAALATAQDPRVSEETHEGSTLTYGGERMSYMEVAVMLDTTDTLATDEGSEPTIGTFEVR
jgi:hypothetical protein